MSNIINPYIAGNPVKSSVMFFGREDVFQFIRQTLIGRHRDNVVILYGQKRTGKTSVLYQVRSHLDARYLCIFMDMQSFALKGLGGFLWELANHIQRGLQREYQITLPSLKRDEFLADPRNVLEHEFLHQVSSAIGDRHVLLMFDEFIYLEAQVRTGHVEPEIFEYLRSLMQHYEWLNFLFSLGYGLEEIQKEYTFLFNVGLYKKISFLDHQTTIDLITRPVKSHYQVEAAAVERIYHITSGHPYYTQLLCHCLFNAWQRQQPHMLSFTVRDVDAVLDEATELGSAVLQNAWDEFTAGEKTVIAGMATAMGKSNHATNTRGIHRAWRRHNVIIAEDEMAQAMKSLLTHDVIIGQDQYIFMVDLQRLWVQKNIRMEWVKAEVTGSIIEELPKPKSLSWPPSPSLKRLLTVALVILLIGGSSRLFYTNYYLPNQKHANATATAQTISMIQANPTIRAAVATLQNPYPPYQGALVLNDPLLDDGRSYQWDEGSGNDCHFPGDGYHVAATVESASSFCAAHATNFSNFVYQAQMSIMKGHAGGIIFRADANNSTFYDSRFDHFPDGNQESSVNRL